MDVCRLLPRHSDVPPSTVLAPPDHTLSDQDLVLLAQSGCRLSQETLLLRYRPLLRTIARTFFLPRAQRQDLFQEAQIGLLKAVQSYRSDRETSFWVFMRLCVTRHLSKVVQSALRHKHAPHNLALSLDAPVTPTSQRTLGETLPSSFGYGQNPEQMTLEQESYAETDAAIWAALSELEREALRAFIAQEGYRDIAHRLNRDPKTIDNAIQRAKRKVHLALANLKKSA